VTFLPQFVGADDPHAAAKLLFLGLSFAVATYPLARISHSNVQFRPVGRSDGCRGIWGGVGRAGSSPVSGGFRLGAVSFCG